MNVSTGDRRSELADSSASTTVKSLALPFVLVAVTFAVGLFRIGVKSYWYDEADSLYFAHFMKFADPAFPERTAMPLYYFLLKLWTGIGGYGEAYARSMSVLSAVAAILLLFRFALKRYGEKVAFIACVLWSSSFLFVMWEQTVRQHMLHAALGILSMSLLFDWIESRSRKDYLWWIGGTTVFLLSQFYGIFLIVAQDLIVLYHHGRSSLKRLIAANLYFAFFVALTIAPFFQAIDIKNGLTPEFAFESKSNHLVQSLSDVAKSLLYGGDHVGTGGIGYEIPEGLLRYPHILGISTLIFALLGIWVLRRKRIVRVPSGADVVLLIWLFVPIVSAYVPSLFVDLVFWVKYFLYCQPALFLLAAFGIAHVLPGNRFAAVVTIGFLALNVMTLKILYYPPVVSSWKETAKTARELTKPGDLLVLCPLRIAMPFTYYFEQSSDRASGLFPATQVSKLGFLKDGEWSRRTTINGIDVTGVLLQQESTFSDQAQLVQEIESYDRVVLVISPHWRSSPVTARHGVLSYFTLRWKMENHVAGSLEDGEVYRFTKNPIPSTMTP